MAKLLKIVLWNANDLTQHAQEIKTSLNKYHVDIMLVSETHFTNRNYFNFKSYNVYDTKHPDGKAHGGIAIIIKNSKRHYGQEKFQEDYMQATSVVIEDWTGRIGVPD